MGRTKDTWVPGEGDGDSLAGVGPTLDPSASMAPSRLGRATADTLSPIDTEGGEAPDRIGSYEIEGELGRGGMGVVYRARQDTPRRLVALKVIRSTISSPRAQQRFVFEAEVLARLDHPGIATVYEARYDGDRHWFAMEFVQGVPLTQYARDRGLDLAGRLALLALLCDAVHHAHLVGVVHRDLKPANVLVTPDGQPKVLDFGIARSLDVDGTPGAGQTLMGEIMGTPVYMSPEQASLDPRSVDARSDVYSLGVMAYELASGRLPLDLSKCKDIPDILNAVIHSEPPRLGRLDPHLRGDVDTIVHKALAKERAHRYQSAAALAEDLRHWAADEPINARAPTAAYQLRKYARRNPAHVVGLAAVGAAVLLGAATSTAFAVRAVRERNEAVAARAQVEERNAALVVLQARAVRATEPTRALAWLRTLPDAAPWADALSEAHEARRLGAAADLLPGHTATVRTIDVAPDGRIATGGYDHEVRVWDRGARTVRVLAGHAGDVQVVRWSPDGRALLSASEDGTVRVWRDGDTTVLGGAGGAVVTAAWRPDGRQIAWGSADGAVRLWDGAGTLVILQHGGPVEHLAFSPDGRRIASAATSGEAAVRDLAGGGTVLLVGHADTVDRVAWTPDGLGVATSGNDRTVRVWDAVTGAPRAVLPHLHEARDLAFVDDRTLVTSGRDGRLGRWDLPTAAVRWTDAHRGVLRDLLVLPGGDVVTAGDDEVVAVWPARGGAPWRLLGHTGRLRELAVGADGHTLATASEDGTARVWDLDPAHRGAAIGHVGAVTDLRFTADGALLTASEDGTARLWHKDGSFVAFSAHTDEVERAVPLPGGLVATAGRDGTVRVWDPAVGIVERFDAPERVDDLAVSPDGRWIAAATRGRTLRLFDRHPARTIDYQGHTDKILSVAFSPDGARFASASADDTARVWTVETRIATAVQELADDATVVAFSPDGARVAVGAGDGAVRLFGVDGGAVTELAPHDGSVAALVFGGRWVATGGVDRVVRVHDLDAGTHRDLVGHTGAVTTLAFVPGGTRLASASEDGTVRMWDLDTGASFRWTAGDRPVRRVAVSPDGRTVAAAGDDGVVRSWPVQVDASPGAVRAWLASATAATLDDAHALTAPWTEVP